MVIAVTVRRALLSVSDRDGLAAFSKGLRELDVSLFATEGTAHFLRTQGVEVTNLEELTGHGTLLEGRVKTLNPKVHGAILSIPGDERHEKDLAAIGTEHFDLVVVNLYPFEMVAYQRSPDKEVIENIDIGGVALLRSAAKNAQHVAILSSPRQYEGVLQELRNQGSLSRSTRDALAIEAFALTSRYDAIISNWLSWRAGEGMPTHLRMAYEKVEDLKYGENPYQKAAFYADPDDGGPSLANCEKLHGPALGYNNYLDFHAALDLVLEFEETAAVVIKHGNPSGVAVRDALADAYAAAYEGDSKAAYGSVVALSREVDADTVSAMKGHFLEGIVAPSYADDALRLLRKRKKARVLLPRGHWAQHPSWEFHRVHGGLLVQTTDAPALSPDALKVVTKARPTDAHVRDLLFATKVCRHAKSNAIVMARDGATVGIGAGQVSRVDAVRLAAMKAEGRARGGVLSSDAFFPFRDGIDEAAAAGVAAILQPGGSIRDEEVVAAADEHGIAMVFSGVRYFRH